MNFETKGLLAQIEEHFRQFVAPKAQDIDTNPAALDEALAGLCQEGWICLRRPASYGGPDVDDATFRGFQELVARYSGALAFLQTQHQSAVTMLAKSENVDLKDRLMPYVGTRDGLIGIGFSQLRRPGPPLVRAMPVEGGYRFSGHLPWATGYGFYPHLMIAGVRPDDKSVFAIVPFTNTAGIHYSEPMRLCAMESAQTVTGELNDYWVSEEDVIHVHEPGWIMKNDLINITLQGYFALGCARGGLDNVWAAFERKKAEFIREAWVALDQELTDCRQAMIDAQQTSGDLTTQEKLDLRAWAIDLSARCAHAGVVATSGGANALSHPAQRVYREALVFSVTAQTSAIMESTLRRLVRRA
ncbi:MAG: acyl-CoA/acyl-ACP dehydrogenase [Armatimonadetes bacterium]|nr:acyl-CoA/acyl-ACP dehydrogenase [Armatimonadota bacterium]